MQRLYLRPLLFLFLISVVEAENIDHGSLPTVAQARISAALGADSQTYALHPISHGFGATNSQFSAQFSDSASVEITHNADRWGISLKRYGFDNAVVKPNAASPRAEGNRVEYRRTDLTEWYVNGPVGLEQGFTIAEPGTSTHPRTFTISLELSGTLHAFSDGRGGLRLANAKGMTDLTYSGLTARDAGGQDLPASLDVQGNELLLHINVKGAKYPVLVDPVIQIAELTASDAVPGALFGVSISIDAGTVVVGAQNGNSFFGALYVFLKPPSGWQDMTQTARLTAQGSFGLGSCVSISGDTIIGCDANGQILFIFVKPTSGWRNTNVSTAHLTVPNSSISFSAAVSGDTIVGGNFLDTAYVFVKPAGGWVTTNRPNAKLVASDGSRQGFGESVAISGQTIIVGDPNAFNAEGAVYLYQKPPGGWTGQRTETARLVSSNGAGQPFLGYSVAMSGNTVVAGATAYNDGAGAALVFVKPAGGWVNMTESAVLTASDSVYLGTSVATNESSVIAGASGTTVNSNPSAGAAYEYFKPADGWVSTSSYDQLMIPADSHVGQYFGKSAAVNGSTIVVGASDFYFSSGSGEAYVFGPPQ